MDFAEVSLNLILDKLVRLSIISTACISGIQGWIERKILGVPIRQGHQLAQSWGGGNVKKVPIIDQIDKFILKQELRAHMALVTRSEEPRAKSSYGMSSGKILRINKLL